MVAAEPKRGDSLLDSFRKSLFEGGDDLLVFLKKSFDGLGEKLSWSGLNETVGALFGATTERASRADSSPFGGSEQSVASTNIMAIAGPAPQQAEAVSVDTPQLSQEQIYQASAAALSSVMTSDLAKTITAAIQLRSFSPSEAMESVQVADRGSSVTAATGGSRGNVPAVEAAGPAMGAPGNKGGNGFSQPLPPASV